MGLVCDGDFAMAGVSGRIPGRIMLLVHFPDCV